LAASSLAGRSPLLAAEAAYSSFERIFIGDDGTGHDALQPQSVDFSWSSEVGDAVVLELVQKCSMTNLEQLGGACTVPARLLQSATDKYALHH
jgi:hypothetical protein